MSSILSFLLLFNQSVLFSTANLTPPRNYKNKNNTETQFSFLPINYIKFIKCLYKIVSILIWLLCAIYCDETSKINKNLFFSMSMLLHWINYCHRRTINLCAIGLNMTAANPPLILLYILRVPTNYFIFLFLFFVIPTWWHWTIMIRARISIKIKFFLSGIIQGQCILNM